MSSWVNPNPDAVVLTTVTALPDPPQLEPPSIASLYGLPPPPKRPKKSELGRPAKRQAERKPENYAYVQGSTEYNIWYHAYKTERGEDFIREPAGYKCDPDIDSGWTMADFPGAEASCFCLWFAKGCCYRGHECTFYHRVPTWIDDQHLKQTEDIFGRPRHASHRDDMCGTGTFTSEGRTIYIGSIVFDRSSPDFIKDTEELLTKEFSKWGELEYCRVIPNMNIGFVRYKLRGNCEFARVAMANQRVGKSLLDVRWAFEDRKQAVVEREAKATLAKHDAAVDAKIERRGWTRAEKWSMLEPDDFYLTTAAYPDTNAQFHTQCDHFVEAYDGDPNEVVMAEKAEREASTAKHINLLSEAFKRTSELGPSVGL